MARGCLSGSVSTSLGQRVRARESVTNLSLPAMVSALTKETDIHWEGRADLFVQVAPSLDELVSPLTYCGWRPPATLREPRGDAVCGGPAHLRGCLRSGLCWAGALKTNPNWSHPAYAPGLTQARVCGLGRSVRFFGPHGL